MEASNAKEEAAEIVQDVVGKLVSSVVGGNTSKEEAPPREPAKEVVETESLADALESLTEESAREIFDDDGAKNDKKEAGLSEKTSTIFAKLLGKEDEGKSKRDSDSNNAKAKLVDQIAQEEVTFSEDSEDRDSLVIAWDVISSRPESATGSAKSETPAPEETSTSIVIPNKTKASNTKSLLGESSQRKEPENKTTETDSGSNETSTAEKERLEQSRRSNHTMEEVVDEFVKETVIDHNSDSNLRSTDDESQHGRQEKGRRTKAKPKRKLLPAIGDPVQVNVEEETKAKKVNEPEPEASSSPATTLQEESKSAEEDINQIVDFIKASSEVKKKIDEATENTKSATPPPPPPKAVTTRRGSKRKGRRRKGQAGSKKAKVNVDDTPVNQVNEEKNLIEEKQQDVIAKQNYSPEKVPPVPAEINETVPETEDDDKHGKTDDLTPTNKVESKAKIGKKKKKKNSTAAATAARRKKSEDAKEKKSVDTNKDPEASGGGASQKVFKPIQNWQKVLRPPNPTNAEPLSKWVSDQVYKNALEPYVPCVPKNTSQRLIESLTDKELEQLSCPGCKDRFLLPTSFFQHIYRKSCRITFVCEPCGGRSLAFYNKCHMRTHVLSHLEVDGLSSIALAAEAVTVAPLDEADLMLGFVDDEFTNELDTLHKDLNSSGTTVKQCSECRVPVADFGSHFNDETGGREVECQECKMWLPNKCSLAAHNRIHGRLPSHVCPECGTGFDTWHMFKHHVQKTCLHEARIMSVECLLCARKHENSLVDWPAIYAHLYQSHVKLYYKCTSCEKAFADKAAIYEHRSSDHKAEEDSGTLVADFSLLYKAAFLKGPHKLFSTREAFENRMAPIVKNWKKSFKFKCFACQTYFDSPDGLGSHNINWCQMQNGGGRDKSDQNESWITATKLFNNKPDATASSVESSGGKAGDKSAVDRENNPAHDLTESETYDKMNEHLAHLEAMSSNCHGCQRIGLDYRAHLTHHTKGKTTSSSTSAEVKSAAVVDQDNNSRSSTPVRITRQRLEAVSEAAAPVPAAPISQQPPSSKKRKVDATIEPEVKPPPPKTPSANKSLPNIASKQKAANVSSSLNSSGLKPMTPFEVSSKSGKKGQKGRKKSGIGGKNQEIKPFVETLGRDVLSNRNLLAFNRLNKQAMTFGATAFKTSPIKASGKHKCALCDFTTDISDSFASHIRVHKPVVNQSVATANGKMVSYKEAATDCLQCKECGMCFASEPSWKKHLFLLHRIKKPSSSDYCEDLSVSQPAPLDETLR